MPRTGQDKTTEQPKRRVSSERLADQIAATEQDFAAAQARFDQAESAAVDVAGEPAEYRSAASEVSKIKAEVDDLSETLDRLKKAHALAVEAERDEKLAELCAKRDALDAKRDAIVAESEEAIIAEVRRHDEAVAALNKTARDSERAVAEVEIEIAEINCQTEQTGLIAAEGRNDQIAAQQHKSWLKMHKATLDHVIKKRGASIHGASLAPCRVCGRKYMIIGRKPFNNETIWP